MPTLAVEVSDEVADQLAEQARRLLLRRSAYVRAVLAAVADEAQRESEPGRSALTRARRRGRETVASNP